MYKLRDKTIYVALIICVAWFLIAQLRYRSRRRTLNLNHNQINVIHEQIEKDKTSLTADPNAPRLEGRPSQANQDQRDGVPNRRPPRTKHR